MTATTEVSQLEIYMKTKSALNDVVKNCLNVQKLADDMKLSISTERWIRDFCQVNFFCGRRSGLTTAMIDVGLAYFNNPLFIFNTDQMGRNAKSIANNRKINATIPNNFESFVAGKSFDAIFLDSVIDVPDSIYHISAIMLSRNDKFVLGFIGA